MQASVNPKAETVEELQSRRKRLHLGMVKLAREDLERLALQTVDDFKVTSPRPHEHLSHQTVDVFPHSTAQAATIDA